jgi:omega-6 fatty acid desaturase (delta-12 desaturase)
VCEYLARSKWGRLRYRLYRHPIVMFGLGPAYLFILQYRLPLGSVRAGVAAVVEHHWHESGNRDPRGHGNMVRGGACISAGRTADHAAWGIDRGLAFYVQHQFEDTLWAHDESWNQHEAAFHGSSHYDLPGILRWFTANIGVHHVHHLCSRIPYYRLPRVLRDHPELGATGRLTLIDSLKCVRLVLWDESRGRLVSFRDMREYRMHARTPVCGSR